MASSVPRPASHWSGFSLDEFEDLLTGYSTQDPSVPFAPLHIEGFNPVLREQGLDQPMTALTMVGRQRLHNFRTLIERVVDEEVPGDILEAGVWRGGASILARAVLAHRGVTDRRVFVADSFEGLPPPSEEYPADKDMTFHLVEGLAVSLEEVQANFAKYGLLDDQVQFVKGWFRDTMPTLSVERLAVLRLDGDMYESTIDPLLHLYDRVSTGGWVIIDDFHLLKCCEDAVRDFARQRGFEPQLISIDSVGAFFQKV